MLFVRGTENSKNKKCHVHIKSRFCQKRIPNKSQTNLALIIISTPETQVSPNPGFGNPCFGTVPRARKCKPKPGFSQTWICRALIWYKLIRNTGTAFGGAPMGRPPSAAPQWVCVSGHFISWIFMDIPYIYIYIYSLYSPYIFPEYVPSIFPCVILNLF